MLIRTVKDLKAHLHTRGISPEDLGRSTRISNMTIRRMMEKPETELISPKYHPALDLYVKSLDAQDGAGNWVPPHALQEFEPILQDLERSGAEPQQVPEIKKQLQAKLTSTPAFQTLRDHTTTILRFINRHRAAAKLRAVAIGALLYFINPADLIPDTLLAVGYLDDFAILSMVVKAIEVEEVDSEKTPSSMNS